MIVGLTGPNAAGKGEVARLLAGHGFRLHSLSDVVRQEAAGRGLGADRETLIKIGQELREIEGPGVLAERILPLLGAREVVDSIRSPFEIEVLRRRHDFRLLGVDAPIELRWERALARNREGDRPDLATFREREERENRDSPTSQQLRRSLALADRIVSNAGTLERLQLDVAELLREWEAALLDAPPTPL